ncbi:PTS N-acetylgalactosamine transporter subunit IIB [Streptococcus suis]|nr:PTS N-acetylgalactosamine transporter subunit IIB [Streptococcus suis]
MPNILLTRIDNRLIHGQVGITWTKTLGANLILVANDELTNDKIMQSLMSVTAQSSGAEARFFTIEKTIRIIDKAAPTQKIFIVTKNPIDTLKLIKGGVPIKEVNVGNMHFSEGKEALSNKVYVDSEEKQCFKEMVDLGIEVYIQDLPGVPKILLKDII